MDKPPDQANSHPPVSILISPCYDANHVYQGVGVYLMGKYKEDFSAKAGDDFYVGYALTQSDMERLTQVIADHPARVAKGKLEFIDGKWVDK